MPGTCVVGLQWGDEAKGKIVDLLGDQFDFVVRFNGGANAGHTVGTAVPAGQGNEEGDERDPGEDRMSELREAENEEQARGNRETHMNDVMSVARAAHGMRDWLAGASGRGVGG